MNIYLTLYDLLNTYIYGGAVVSETYQDLVCITIATIGCLFVFAIPFLITWRVIKLFIGR